MNTCHICKRDFSVRRNLLRRLRTVHDNTNGWSCQFCEAKFTRKDNLSRHEETCSSRWKPSPAKKQRLSFEDDDPLQCPDELDSSLPEECQECYRTNWKEIRSRKRLGQYVKVYTYRLKENGDDLQEMLFNIFYNQGHSYKLNISFGYFLQHSEIGEIRFYYPSQNGFIFNQPKVISNEEDLQRVLQDVEEKDWLEYARNNKPNSKWRVLRLVNVAFHVYPLLDRPIGRGDKGKLPKWVVENRGVDALEKNYNTGKVYEDNLCFFRCLALHQGCKVKNLETKTKELASQYFRTMEDPNSFTGVRLSDLLVLDKVFGIHTFVYCIDENRRVELIHRPALKVSKQDTPLRLNLYDDHFSYIKDLDTYSRCFVCDRCDVSFPKAHRLHRH